MDAETYYIPANYTDAGKLFGLFEIRNAIEAVLVGLPVLGFCAVCLPLELTFKRFFQRKQEKEKILCQTKKKQSSKSGPSPTGPGRPAARRPPC